MTLAETIDQHVRALPVSLQREALDYIAFLEARYGIVADGNQLPAKLDTEAFISRHAGALGTDFPDDADLGALPDIPRESF